MSRRPPPPHRRPPTATTAGPVVKTMYSSPLVPSSSPLLFYVVAADGPSPLGTAHAAGTLVLGSGAGAALFLNKEDKDDNKARGDEGSSSSPPLTMSNIRLSLSSASLNHAAKYDERGGGRAIAIIVLRVIRRPGRGQR